MQNRYVGDVGDYGKYALLRAISQTEPVIQLAVIWCLFPDERFNSDGKHISYLKDNHFAKLDESLHAELANIVHHGKRAIDAIENSKCFRESTIFCADPILTTYGMKAGPKERLRLRAEWLQACLHRTHKCELVFFDPDNGLEIASIPKHHPKGGKYIYWDELISFWKRGHSLLVYHHLNRTTSAAEQVEMLARRFAAEFPNAKVAPLVFRRGSSRVFWLIHRGDDLGRELQRRAADMLSGGWSRHFRPFGWPGEDQTGKRAL